MTNHNESLDRAAPQPQAPSSDDARDRRIAEWKSSYDAKCLENTTNFLRAERAEAECDTLRKDAGRYKHLRDIWVNYRTIKGGYMHIVTCNTEDALDAALDAAIDAAKERKERE